MDLFWKHVQILGLDQCWEWQASTRSNGYGSFTSGKHHNLPIASHRVAYTLTHGPIQKGDVICHSCDNRRCCNPTHLWKGTHLENVRDKMRKGRSNIPHLKLTDAQVQAILKDPRTQVRIAKEYGVSQALISLIKSRHNRKGIQSEV